MFGKEYAHHPTILLQSFGEMNEVYKTKVKKTNKRNHLLTILIKIYILIVGIPEIGFQLRSLYFKNITTTYLINKNLQNIFDAGSGIGSYTFWLSKVFPNSEILGGEIDRKKIIASNRMKRQQKANNVSFKYIDITKKQKAKQFDFIVTIDVLEHIPDYEKVLNNFSHLLKSNGYLYIHVPQPNQKRIFSAFKKWHHHDHVREGISRKTLSQVLKAKGFQIIIAKDTFGFFGKLAWEINHFMLSKSFFMTGITYPFLYVLTQLDTLQKNKQGLGIAVLAQKKI